MDYWIETACSKVNLALDVLGKYENGYHEVKMIMQSLSLSDRLIFRKSSDEGEFKVNLSIDAKTDIYEKSGIIDEAILAKIRSQADKIPTDERNLICKAAMKMAAEYNLTGEVDIILEKQIPSEAGMAGGSADAAATLRGINKLYELGVFEEKLCKLGATFGADIPFCIIGGAMLCEGIGEKLSDVSPLSDCYVLCAKPPVGVSTGVIYTEYDALADEEITHPDVDGMINALDNQDVQGVAERLGNVLELVTAPKLPEIGKLELMMKESGAINAIMTGSGSTVFGIYLDLEQARTAARKIVESGIAFEVAVTEPVA